MNYKVIPIHYIFYMSFFICVQDIFSLINIIYIFNKEEIKTLIKIKSISGTSIPLIK